MAQNYPGPPGHETDRAAPGHQLGASQTEGAQNAKQLSPGPLSTKSAGRDQAAADRDSVANRRDLVNTERDTAADERDQIAALRDGLGNDRDTAADNRDGVADQRDRAAALRDNLGDERDAAADNRDAVAELRDQRAARLAHQTRLAPAVMVEGPPGATEADDRLRSSLLERRAAAQDRERASQDRLAGAHERAQAETDRGKSVKDRAAGSADREQAGADRNIAHSDREAGAARREYAAQDRELAFSDRGASEIDRRRASLDTLTGAYLRGAGFHELEREIGRAHRVGRSMIVAFFDVDHLKTINDTRGHAAGDTVLIRIADTLRANLRTYDLVIRYGGDEFVCALTGLGMPAAISRFEQVAAVLEGGEDRVSLTVGIVELLPDETADRVVARADAALYETRQRERPLPS